MGQRRCATTKPSLTLLIGLLKRTALKAEAHVGCCHGAHQGDGSRLPKMAVLLLGLPVEMNLSRAFVLPDSGSALCSCQLRLYADVEPRFRSLRWKGQEVCSLCHDSEPTIPLNRRQRWEAQADERLQGPREGTIASLSWSARRQAPTRVHLARVLNQ